METVKDETFIVSIARMCHEANRAYCRMLGDSTQKPWDQADQWQRDSAIAGVVFKFEHPHATAEEQHVAWCHQKQQDGWVRKREISPALAAIR